MMCLRVSASVCQLCQCVLHVGIGVFQKRCSRSLFGDVMKKSWCLALEKQTDGIVGMQSASRRGAGGVRLRVFHNVTVKSVVPTRNGLVHVLQLDLTDPRIARINWTQTRMLMRGSLLVRRFRCIAWLPLRRL